MGIILYDKVSSSCCRAVRLVLEALDLEYESHLLDIANGENFSDYYLKMNPEHTFPTLDDNGFILTDSHAINIYLVTKYGKGDHPLYPSCVKKRALINRRLFFETGVLFPSEKRIFRSVIKEHAKEANPKEVKLIRDSYTVMETFLAQTATKYIAGNEITLADISFVPQLTNLNTLVPDITEDKYPLLAAYMKRLEENVKGYEKINAAGHRVFLNILKEANYTPPK